MRGPAERPEVMDSSQTMAFSGIRAQSAVQMASGVSGPVGKGGRLSWARLGGSVGAFNSLAKVFSASDMSSWASAKVWICASGGAMRLGLFG